MGLDFMLAAIARPLEIDPDWPAIHAAASRLPPDIEERVARWLGWDDEDFDDDYPVTAGDAAEAAVLEVHQALARGSTSMTVVEHGGRRFYLDGGVSPGEYPSPTWEAMVTLSETGLLGEALCTYSGVDGAPPPVFEPAPVPDAEAPAALLAPVAPIAEHPRLVVFALPSAPDWPAARKGCDERLAGALDRLEAIVAGAYTRTLAVVGREGVGLLVVDRAEPRSLALVLELEDALARAGITRLNDARLEGGS